MLVWKSPDMMKTVLIVTLYLPGKNFLNALVRRPDIQSETDIDTDETVSGSTITTKPPNPTK